MVIQYIFTYLKENRSFLHTFSRLHVQTYFCVTINISAMFGPMLSMAQGHFALGVQEKTSQFFVLNSINTNTYGHAVLSYVHSGGRGRLRTAEFGHFPITIVLPNFLSFFSLTVNNEIAVCLSKRP